MLRISQQLLGDQWERKQIVAKGIWVLNFPRSVHKSETVPGRETSVWQMIVDIDGFVCLSACVTIHASINQWITEHCNMFVPLCLCYVCVFSVNLSSCIVNHLQPSFIEICLFMHKYRVCMHIRVSEEGRLMCPRPLEPHPAKKSPPSSHILTWVILQ